LDVRLTDREKIFIILIMNKLRDCAIVLGLAGAILMVTADTKEVEATNKISYKSESVSCIAFTTAGEQWLKEAETELARIREEQEIKELERQAAEQAEQERIEAEEREAAEAAEEEERRAAEEAAEKEQAAEAQAAAIEEAEVIPEAEVIIENSGWIYTVSEADYNALLKIVEAEASGEDITGKMMVANVVLNRVKSGSFPNTIEEVVYQRKGGKAQFSPVSTGKIERVRVSESTIEAVERSLCGEDPSQGALYFVAPAYANPDSLQWFRNSLTMLFVYHGHEFYA
jgi:spore germination cell wall hydrolase CwlJ-like protein